MTIDKINAYLESKESAWAPATYSSEKSRLHSVAADLHLGPQKLKKKLEAEGKKPYSIKTLFIRLADLEKFLGEPAGYGQYLETHKNRFKHVYVKEEIEMTFEEAMRRIAQLESPYKEQAQGMLLTGVRISEAYKVAQGRVTGKGGKSRKIFGTIELTAPKSTFWLKLKAVGLKPHTLRKLCATRLADKGATAADLCKVFGWTDIKTAYQYLQAKEDSRLETLMAEGKERS